MNKDRNTRIANLLSWKVRFMFKDVLGAIEEETKKYNIDKEFFESQDKKSGYPKIRKILLDHGNTIIELTGIILDQLELTPEKSIVMLDEKVVSDLNKEGNADVRKR